MDWRRENENDRRKETTSNMITHMMMTRSCSADGFLYNRVSPGQLNRLSFIRSSHTIPQHYLLTISDLQTPNDRETYAQYPFAITLIIKMNKLDEKNKICTPVPTIK